ncbi:EamA-like transporter family protein [Meinhardsimonia xiamenensis]|jgi:drug/metabolite transporter (DMT)-like permease|uniref:EamA-like transporter family protein n=2 Tax=Meinhardsimonia xiamenensis TaxID=990712 RepID=A0A1G8YPS7_9RHOB|nr:EamA-like transporter family protein [Meinhardsimonia xiamenensis]SDK04788.1 EamA-like transporter family protein [Meinhardsimonia xiamenensis]
MVSQGSPIEASGAVLAAMAVISLTDSLVVTITGHAGLWQFHLLRALCALPLIALAARLARLRLRPLAPAAVALRSLLLSGAMLFYFGALAFMPVAEAAAGLFTAPIFVVVISAFAFGVRPGWRRIGAIVLGFSGVLLVLRPELGGGSAARFMPLAAALLYALSAIVTRRLCHRESTPALLAGFFAAMAAWGALGCGLLALLAPPVPEGPAGFLLRAWGPTDAGLLLRIAGLALGAVIGVGLITRAYLLAETSLVAGLEYSMLVFAAFWGWLLWGQVPGLLEAAGMTLILCSGALLTLSARRAELRDAAVPAEAAP